jgi:hypothetical protein
MRKQAEEEEKPFVVTLTQHDEDGVLIEAHDVSIGDCMRCIATLTTTALKMQDEREKSADKMIEVVEGCCDSVKAGALHFAMDGLLEEKTKRKEKTSDKEKKAKQEILGILDDIKKALS